MTHFVAFDGKFQLVLSISENVGFYIHHLGSVGDHIALRFHIHPSTYEIVGLFLPFT